MINILKFILYGVATIHSIYYILLFKSLKFKYKTVSTMVSRFSGKYGIYLRENFYKKTLKKCGKNFQIAYGSFIVYDDVEIGDNCAIEEFSIISKCIIGDNVIIAARCSIMSGGHHHDIDNLSRPFRDSNLLLKKLILNNNLWIGTHAVIMNDVSEGTVVGAGSVVTKIFAPNSVIAGIPAQHMRQRGKK